jgi:hypothetical protein
VALVTVDPVIAVPMGRRADLKVSPAPAISTRASLAWNKSSTQS